MDPWTLRFRAMVSLKRDAPSGVYVTIIKVLFMLRQVMMWQNHNKG
jgi:hypothetical protein